MFYYNSCGGLTPTSPQIFVKTKEERLKNQQREYEAQMQYRQHLQVSAATKNHAVILFDCFQYANTEGEGLGDLVMFVTSGRQMGSLVPRRRRSVITERLGARLTDGEVVSNEASPIPFLSFLFKETNSRPLPPMYLLTSLT